MPAQWRVAVLVAGAALLAPSPLGAQPIAPSFAAPARAANASAPACRVVAFLHVPKCAGSSVRYMFKRGSPGTWRCPNICTQLSSVCKAWGCDKTEPLPESHVQRWRKRGLPPLDARTEPLWFFERHCGPNLERFARWLPKLRRHAESRGCRFAALTLLRDPISMLLSDFSFFGDYSDRANLSLSQWARSHPELLLLDEDQHLDTQRVVPALERARQGKYAPSVPEPAVRHLEALRRAYADAQLAFVRHMPTLTAELRAEGGARRAAWMARSARLQQASLAARARWLQALRAAGVLSCERLLAAVEPLLSLFDVVGVVDRFAESMLLTTEALGMRGVPTLRFSNSRRRAGDAAGRARPNAVELDEMLPGLRALNNCSIQLVDRARARLDARVARRGDAFHARLARAREKMRPPDR